MFGCLLLFCRLFRCLCLRLLLLYRFGGIGLGLALTGGFGCFFALGLFLAGFLLLVAFASARAGDCGEDEQDRVLLSEAMTNAGITPLFNASESIQIGTGRICIAGLDDVTAGKPDLKSLVNTLPAADYVIFMAHNPSVIAEAQQTRDASGSLSWFNLGLFGHTHGGQMQFFAPLLGIADDVPERYTSGWFTENRVDLLVSRGVGTSVFPGRFLCPPQIHLIEITCY